MNGKKVVAIGVVSAGLVFATAGAANAHSADITGEASCLDDGTYNVAWHANTYNVPSNTEGAVKIITPVNEWIYEWTEHNANHGLPPLAPNASFDYTVSYPGDATSANVTFQIDYKDGYSFDPEGSIPLPGDCVVPPVEPSPTPTPTDTTPPALDPSPSEMPPVSPPVTSEEPPITPEQEGDAESGKALAATGGADLLFPALAGIVILSAGIAFRFGRKVTRDAR